MKRNMDLLRIYGSRFPTGAGFLFALRHRPPCARCENDPAHAAAESSIRGSARLALRAAFRSSWMYGGTSCLAPLEAR